jgi:hypothetical protein
VIFGAVVGLFGLAPAMLLVVLDRRGVVERPVAVLLGVLGGAVGGSGLLLGAIHQPTTANIHSGYSFAGVLEWLLLCAVGVVVGGATGGLLGWLLPVWRGAVVVLLLLAGGGAAGWIVASSRTTIDCDERPSFCADRYD